MFDINVHGLFYCNRAIVPEMMKRDYGRIVNIASVAGKEGNPNASAYSASKAAVIGLTKSLGKELARTGIRVNCAAQIDPLAQLFVIVVDAQFAGVGDFVRVVFKHHCHRAVKDLAGGKLVHVAGKRHFRVGYRICHQNNFYRGFLR